MPDADIIDLDDRRRVSELPPESRVIVTFYSAQFSAGTDDKRETLAPNYEVPASRALELIEEAKRLGGMWLPAEDDRLWFLPWPPAAVSIRPAR
jgi:hypothetical protein